jgi:hypothetical protein
MTRKANKITRLLLATSSLLWMSIMEQLHVTEGRLQFVDLGIRKSFDIAQKLKINYYITKLTISFEIEILN